MRRDPGRDDAKHDPGDQREEERKAKNHGRGAGLNGKLSRVGKGKIQDHAGAEISDDDSNHAPDDGEDYAFGEPLPDQDRACGAESSSDGGLGAASRSSGEKKVGDIGACDQQDQGGDSSEQPQAVAGFLLKILNATSTGSKNDVLLGNFFVAAVAGVRQLRG